MKKNQEGFTLTELLVVITIIGILAGLLMTSLARGKAKAYRISCVSNIGSVFKAGLNFGQDNGERLPWQLTKPGVLNHFGNTASAGTVYSLADLNTAKKVIEQAGLGKNMSHSSAVAAIVQKACGRPARDVARSGRKTSLAANGLKNIAIYLAAATAASGNYGAPITSANNEVTAHASSLKAGGCFGTGAMKAELVTPKILHSPCDASRKVFNIALEEDWKNINTKANSGSKIATVADGASYCLVRGADTMRPTSIYSITRNCSSDSLSSGKWVGNDDAAAASNTKVMAGLSSSQGQLVTMDGGARQSQDSDLSTSGALVKPALEATGGVAKGATSMAVIRGAGL